MLKVSLFEEYREETEDDRCRGVPEGLAVRPAVLSDAVEPGSIVHPAQDEAPPVFLTRSLVTTCSTSDRDEPPAPAESMERNCTGTAVVLFL